MKKVVFSNEQKLRKNRIMSAKTLSHGTIRPISSISHRKDNKQSIPNLFHLANMPSTQTNRQNTLLTKQSLLDMKQILKYCKQPTLQTTRQREDLFADNQRLKKQINKLQEQLAILKGKYQAKTTHIGELGNKFKKQLDKDVHWMGSQTHMISGVKRQYQSLKKQFKQKSQECENLKKALMQKKVPQLQIYVEQLTNENKRLEKKLKNLIQSEQKMQQLNIKYQTGSLQRILISLQQQLDQVISKNKTQQSQINRQCEIINQKQKKINLLENLLIERQNKKFHSKRTKIKLQKQLKDKNIEIDKLRDKVQDLKVKSKLDNQRLRTSMNLQISQLKNQIQGKSKIISNLEENSKHMEATLYKLKINSLQNNSSNRSKDLQYSAFTNSNQLHKSSIGFNLQNQSVHGYTSNNTNRQDDLTQSITLNKNFLSNHKYSHDIDEEQQYREQHSRVSGLKRERIVAWKKYDEDSKRVNRVKIQEIQPAIDLLRYRIIFSEINVNSLKQLLDYKNYLRGSQKNSDPLIQDEALSITETQSWQKQFINVNELKKTLKNQPLNLGQDYAELIARYIVEDSEQDGYMYINQQNQQNRQIAKSILKALIGQYSLPSEDIKQGMKQFLNKYGTNLLAALRDLHPSKKISQSQFLQVLVNLGMQASQMQKQLIIAKMSLKSNSLSELEYEYLF